MLLPFIDDENKKPSACFFSTSGKSQILKEQYSIQDINILKELGYTVIIASKFSEIPWKCDLYFSWWASGSILPFIVSFIARKPIIVVAGGNESMYYRDSVSKKALGYLSTPWYKKIATRITLKFSTRIVIVSEFMRSNVMQLGAKNPILVHNSVDSEKFIPLDIERSEILTIFKFDREVVELKRGYILMQAIPLVLNKYPQQIFTFVGGIGNAFNEFVTKCKELGISSNVRFINDIPNEDVVNWMQRAKVYIQISDTETFGVAVAEAMSCETPVVVSNRGALPELVGDFGVFVDHNNFKSVSEGILKILDLDDNGRKLLGNKLRNRIINNYDFKLRKLVMGNIINDICL